MRRHRLLLASADRPAVPVRVLPRPHGRLGRRLRRRDLREHVGRARGDLRHAAQEVVHDRRLAVSLCNKTLRVAIIAAAICLQACAGGHSDTSLDVIGVDGGTPEVHAHWGYTSGKVDVDIDVTTVESPACATTARLVIDKALSSAETYRLHETDCKT